MAMRVSTNFACDVDVPTKPHLRRELRSPHFTNSAPRRRMDPRVRDLYKRILVVGRDYPAGLDHVRERAKAEFGKRAALTDDVEIKRAIAYGRYMVKEMIGVVQLKKYRTMKKRYVPDD